MPLAYVLDRFPVPSETFVARELEGLARLGVRPRLWALRASRAAAPSAGSVPPSRASRRAAATSDRAAEIATLLRILPPPVSRRFAAANLALLRRAPLRLLDAGLELLRGTSRSARTFPAEYLRAAAGLPLARELEREGVTHVHAHFGFVPSTVAWLASRLTGIPFSVSVHAWDIFANRSMLPEKLVAARRVVTCTEYARRFLRERYPSLDPRKVVCVHHGIDLDAYAPMPMPLDETTRVVAVGRLAPKKGFGVLLRAFARARACLRATHRQAALVNDGRDISLTLAGDGPERARLERLARSLDLGDSLRMTGALSSHGVREEMARAHFLVVSSVSGPRGDLDGLPNVMLEAMATARPVVASWLSGIPEGVEDGVTGLLVPPGDEEALARAMVGLARDRDLARRMGEAGRRLVEARFSIDDSARKLAGVFREMGAIA